MQAENNLCAVTDFSDDERSSDTRVRSDTHGDLATLIEQASAELGQKYPKH